MSIGDTKITTNL